MHPYPLSAKQGGFTLLELMISLSLGMILLLTCFSGLRLTAQTLILSKHNSEEDALLRIGVEQALDETDFWTLCDNPVNASQEPLRGGSQTTGYMPFTPFTQTPDYAAHPTTGKIGFEDTAPGFDESTTIPHGGWNPSPLAWAAWNPRTWTRANVAEAATSTQAYGTFDIYDNLDSTKSWHYWYDDQIRGLIDALGFYGLFEYVPSNAHIIYHGVTAPLGDPNGMSWGWEPTGLIWNGKFLQVTDGLDNNMKGRERNSNGSRYYFPGPQAIATNPMLARAYADIGYNGRNLSASGIFNLSQVTAAMADSVASAELMPVRPANWNDVTFETHRFIERGHPLTLCLVNCASSISGHSFLISFTCIGTTLRGARQQRAPTSAGGWVANPYTDPTLDYQVSP